jgi:holo-[acyl-carrier protein] synthase
VIIGLGIDLCDIRRIEKMLSDHGDRFPRRCFTATERARAEGRAARAATYAKRFAAKEACAKALGTGLGRGVSWRDMGVVNDAMGRPALQLTGGAATRLAALTPVGCAAHVHLTMTDEYPLAQAMVMIEARPKP